MEVINIEAIKDRVMVKKLKKLAQQIVTREIDLNSDWIRDHKWTVVPTESTLTTRDEELISNACKAFGYDECFAIVTEAQPFYSSCYRFKTTKKGIFEINALCSANHYLIMPEDQGFSNLRPFGLYSLIAGPKRFVELAVGSTIEGARESFWKFANDSNWAPRDRDFLTSLARMYSSISAS